MCVTFVVFTDRESCTRPISTNSRSMEAGEYGLTRGTYFFACRLELDAVAGLLWMRVCFGCGGFFRVFSCFFVVFSLNAHGLLQVCGRLALFTFLLVQGCVRVALFVNS